MAQARLRKELATVLARLSPKLATEATVLTGSDGWLGGGISDVTTTDAVVANPLILR
jgi:hypothetical protein